MDTTLVILITLAVFVLFCIGLAVVLRGAYRAIKKGVINAKQALAAEKQKTGADSSSAAKSAEALRCNTEKIQVEDQQNNREEAERRAREEAEINAYREAVQRKQADIARQKAEIENREPLATSARVAQDKSSSHYQSSRQWPKVNDEDRIKENAPSPNRMVHSQVTAPKVSKSSSHYETSKDWPAVEQTESERKGFAFERYVDAHFPNKFFKRMEWRSDIKDVDGRLSESSKYPDLEYEIRKSGVRFAVECKWRQSFLRQDVKQIIWWARDTKQITNYVQYGKRQNLDVIVIIGIGGTPDEPDKVYSMPLSKLGSPYITKDELWNYFVGKQSSFFFVPEEHNIRLYNK